MSSKRIGIVGIRGNKKKDIKNRANKNKTVLSEKLRPFFTLVDRRKKLHRELCEQAPDLFDRHMEAMIPYSSAVERMGEEGLPLEILSPRSNPAQSYRKLWKEIQSELRMWIVVVA